MTCLAERSVGERSVQGAEGLRGDGGQADADGDLGDMALYTLAEMGIVDKAEPDPESNADLKPVDKSKSSKYEKAKLIMTTSGMDAEKMCHIFTVAELQQFCSVRGLSTSGAAFELAMRLKNQHGCLWCCQWENLATAKFGGNLQTLPVCDYFVDTDQWPDACRGQ